MKFLKKTAFSYAAPLLGAFSVAAAPLEIKAQCCDPAPCCIDWCSMLVPALVGAAAGAGTAAAINNKGKRGKRGEVGASGDQGERGVQGPEGANPFLRDVENSLNFSFTINSIAFDSENPSFPFITPFVSTPDGRVLTGTPFNFTPTMTSVVTSIAISSPVYGTYTLGLLIPPFGASFTMNYSLHVIPSDGRGTTNFSSSGAESFPSSSNQVQLFFDYSYGAKGTVPLNG